MNALIRILKELVSLFVDDGSLAAIVLIWITLCGLLLRFVATSPAQGLILFIGLALILIENAVRGARADAARRLSRPAKITPPR